jgi:hypothetical protein
VRALGAALLVGWLLLSLAAISLGHSAAHP